ncbi:MAG: hypothetical protein M4579_004776 [Chaenotheca gracillima]|nr:MAG: hypothetical protein M4579_004776 [Chaenotheca gracillima]
MSTSSLPTQAFLMQIIQEVIAPPQLYDTFAKEKEQITASTEEEPVPETTDDDAHDTQDKVTGMLESDLQMEEQLGKLVAENKVLQNENQSRQKALDAHRDRLLRIQENNEILREQLIQAEDRLLANETARSGLGTEAGSILRKNENKIREQDELISQYESSISGLQEASETQRRTIDSFSLEREKAQRNQDLLDESKAKIDDLTRRANTAEHFKQKLEASQGLEKSIRELRLENERLQARLRHSEEEKKQSQGDQMTIEQYKRTQERIELDHSQLQTVKRQLELDIELLRQRSEGATEQQTRDAEVIAEQQERIRELESGSSGNGEIGNDLAAELDATDKSKSDLKLEVSRLKSDLQRSRDSGEAGAENIMLKNTAQDAEKKAERFEQRYLDTQQSKLVLESEIKALLDGNAGEGSEVFNNLRETFIKAKKDLENAASKLENIESELRETKRELANAKTSLGLVDKDKITQLNELKNSVSEELIELREEHKVLQARADDYRDNLDSQKTLLNSALLEKDSLQKELAGEKDLRHHAEISKNDLKATLEALDGRKEGARDVLEERILQLHTTLEKLRVKQSKKSEHIKKQKAALLDLEQRLKLAEANGQETVLQEKEKQDAEKKTATDQEVANLQHELSLMSTAWYDLTSRLQMPNVAVQRKSDARSFMNKQRQLISGSVVRHPIGPIIFN